MDKQIEQLAKDILSAETEFAKTGKPVLEIERYVAKHLIEQGCRKVVMCCECKYCEVVIDSIIDEPKYFCTKIANSIQVDPTDYCSRAKMKGE